MSVQGVTFCRPGSPTPAVALDLAPAAVRLRRAPPRGRDSGERLARIAACAVLWMLVLRGDGLAQPRGPAAPDSPAVQELLATPIGADVASALWLLEATRQLGLKREAERLRAPLVDAYLHQLSGEPPDPGTTVGQLLDMPARASGEAAAARWARAVNRHLAAEWTHNLEPAPRQFDTDASNWKTLASGLWHASRDNGEARAMVLALRLRNTSGTALALGEFRLVAVGTAVGDIRFDCRWPRGEEALPQAPGQTGAWLCEALDPPAERHPAFAAVVRELSGQAPVQLRLLPSDFDDPTSEQQSLARLLLTSPAREKLADFLNRNAACERRDDCHMVRPSMTDDPLAPQIGRRVVPWTVGERLLAGGVALVAFAAYVPLARRFGNRRTFLGIWLLGSLLALSQWSPGFLDGVRGSLMAPVAWFVMLAAFIVGPGVPAVLCYWLYRLLFERERRGR